MDLNLDLKLAEHPMYDEIERLQRKKDELFQQADEASGELDQPRHPGVWLLQSCC